MGRRIGAYRILRELGRGGMGAVYLAERADEQFRKQVAITLVKHGMDSDAILHRFRSKQQILASLDHPQIATLLNAGTTDDGLSYFVMEYVEGQPIDVYCTTHDLSTRERLHLFGLVCAAVRYAHEHQVVHRDQAEQYPRHGDPIGERRDGNVGAAPRVDAMQAMQGRMIRELTDDHVREQAVELRKPHARFTRRPDPPENHALARRAVRQAGVGTLVEPLVEPAS